MTKPRLRRKGGGKGAEVAAPAYTAMQHGTGLREKLAAILLRGVSTGYLETEKHFRRIKSYGYLWVLRAKLQEIRELCLERL